MKTMRVNPAEINGKPLVVLREDGRIIESKPGGTQVPCTAFYNRLLKEGGLVKVNTVVESYIKKEDKKKGGK